MPVTRFSPVRTGLTAIGGGKFPGGSPLPGAGNFPGVGAGGPGGLQKPSIKVERDENKGGGGDLDDSRGGGGGNSGVDLKKALQRDSFETGPLRPVGAPAPALGATAMPPKDSASGERPAALSETGTADAGQQSPAQKLLGLLKEFLASLNKGAHRDDSDLDDGSRSGGGIADGAMGNTQQG